MRLELALKIVKPVVSVSVKKESGSGGGPPWHASAVVPPGPVVGDVLSELEQAVTAQMAKIHGRMSAEERCENGVIDPSFPRYPGHIRQEQSRSMCAGRTFNLDL